MKAFIKSSLIGCLCLSPGLLYASDFEAALSSETAQFTLRSDSSLIGWGGSELGLGLFYNEASDYVGQFSLLQRRQSSQQNPLTLGVGVRIYVGQLDDLDVDIFAAGIGGEISYTFPGVMPMSLYLRGHFAPQITSFADIEEINDVNFGFQIEILPQTTAFIGIRHLELELDTNGNPQYELDDDNAHIGIRMTF